MNAVLPVRRRMEMVQAIGDLLKSLHGGSPCMSLIERLKGHALFFESQVQQDVLMLAGAVQLQAACDPWHRVTPEVARCAARLAEDLGFSTMFVYGNMGQP